MSTLLFYLKYLNCINELSKFYSVNDIKLSKENNKYFQSLLSCEIKLKELKSSQN